ncbi:MAG: response regulator [Gammaproteobacteria bacterium]|nr:response regulator [Gammaproteobacteria bacterium]MCP5459582.1 response regulator [Gammaproteobacteria bacterium]
MDKLSIINSSEFLPVLLVEDNLGEAHRLRLELADAATKTGALLPRFKLDHVRTLADALQHLEGQECAVVLLDLSLPDSAGLDTFYAIFRQAQQAAVVILTGNPDDTLAIDAIRCGAQDYLAKGELTGPLLARAVCYAAERQRLQIALAEAREQERQQRELHSLARFSEVGPAPVSARSFGQLSLRETNPPYFASLVQKYRQVLDWSLEQIAYKVDHPISEMLQSLAEQLGFIGAGPRDVVEIYLTALKASVQDATPQRIQAYGQEGKLIAFELMGKLVNYYRLRAVNGARLS